MAGLQSSQLRPVAPPGFFEAGTNSTLTNKRHLALVHGVHDSPLDPPKLMVALDTVGFRNQLLFMENDRLAKQNALLRGRISKLSDESARVPRKGADAEAVRSEHSSAKSPCWLRFSDEGSVSSVFAKPVVSPSTTDNGDDDDAVCDESDGDDDTIVLSEDCSDNEAAVFDEDKQGCDGRTTVILRNIPSDYTRQQLIDLMDSKGFFGDYNFLYFPINFSRGLGFGYAFVSLVSPEKARRFGASFQGVSDWGTQSDRVCEVSWTCTQQGLEANIERYRESPVMHESVPDDHKPMIFENGVGVPFPPPRVHIQRPRPRRGRD